jgi:hypothetical protein
LSSNNYILIKENNRPARYTISHRDADTGKRLSTIGHSVSLEEAVRLAYDCGIVPEYNLVIKLYE